jgi:hypothetical protein
MSHHVDSPTGREDPRLNLCGVYVFEARAGRAVMGMTVNPQASTSEPALFREDAVHAFRFDTNGDGHENVSFKVRFANVADGSDVRGQHFSVHHATEPDAGCGIDGEPIVDGSPNEVVSRSDVRCSPE